MRSTWKRFRSALVALAVVLPAGSFARADTIDLAVPRALVVGSPRGAAPSDRLDPQRTGRARARLPSPPVEAWRRHVNGGIDHAPVIDAQGNIHVALNIPEVIKLSPDSKELWRARLGSASAPAPPTLTSDGTLAVVTSAGMAWGFTASGAVRYTTQLGVRGRDIDVAPLALADGGLAIAGGSTLIELDRDGAVRARTTLEGRAPGAVFSTPERATGALIAGPEGTLITTDTGAVYTWRPPAAPRRLGTFGGSPRRGAMLADNRTLMAVIDARRVVSLDLRTGVSHVRSGGGGGVFFDGPVTLGPQQLALVAAQSGVLVGLDAAGNEKIRLTIEKPPPLPAAGAGGVVGGVIGGSGIGGLLAILEQKPSPPLVIDPDGRIAFARANGRVGVVAADGRIELAGERVCGTPVAIVPAGDKRMLLACKDGGLFLFGG